MEFLKKYALSRITNVGFWIGCFIIVAVILRSELLQLALAITLTLTPDDALKSVAKSAGDKAKGALNEE